MHVVESIQQAVRTIPSGRVRDSGTEYSVKFDADYDDFIEASNQSAWINVVQGVLLTAAILFLFLYNLRSLCVVAVTMPLTMGAIPKRDNLVRLPSPRKRHAAIRLGIWIQGMF